MRTVLYTGIHQKNNGIIAWEYNWENKLFSILFEKSEVQNITYLCKSTDAPYLFVAGEYDGQGMIAVYRIISEGELQFLTSYIYKKGTFSHLQSSIFDEYIHILNTMSYREIQYLVEYKKYCEDSSKRGKSTKHINGRTYSNKYESFCNEYSKQIKVSPGEVDYVFLHIKQTGFIEEEFETESGDVDENDNTFDSLDVESKGYYITKEFLDFYEMVLKRNENNG